MDHLFKENREVLKKMISVLGEQNQLLTKVLDLGFEYYRLQEQNDWFEKLIRTEEDLTKTKPILDFKN